MSNLSDLSYFLLCILILTCFDGSKVKVNQKRVCYHAFIKNSQGRALFQWECVDENSKRAKDAKYRKDRGEIPSKMSNATRKICALSFAYSSALVNRPKKEIE